jgi:hypothetical protein
MLKLGSTPRDIACHGAFDALTGLPNPNLPYHVMEALETLKSHWKIIEFPYKTYRKHKMGAYVDQPFNEEHDFSKDKKAAGRGTIVSVFPAHLKEKEESADSITGSDTGAAASDQTDTSG